MRMKLTGVALFSVIGLGGFGGLAEAQDAQLLQLQSDLLAACTAGAAACETSIGESPEVLANLPLGDLPVFGAFICDLAVANPAVVEVLRDGLATSGFAASVAGFNARCAGVLPPLIVIAASPA